MELKLAPFHVARGFSYSMHLLQKSARDEKSRLEDMDRALKQAAATAEESAAALTQKQKRADKARAVPARSGAHRIMGRQQSHLGFSQSALKDSE